MLCPNANGRLRLELRAMELQADLAVALRIAIRLPANLNESRRWLAGMALHTDARAWTVMVLMERRGAKAITSGVGSLVELAICQKSLRPQICRAAGSRWHARQRNSVCAQTSVAARLPSPFP